MRWKQFFTPIEVMYPAEFNAFMGTGPRKETILLDVRQPKESEGSLIPGTLLIPLPELWDRMGELDKEKTIIAY